MKSVTQMRSVILQKSLSVVLAFWTATACAVSLEAKLNRLKFEPGSREIRFPAECSIRITFGGALDRPTHATKEKIESLLAKDTKVNKIYVKPWGKEGESTWCIVGLDKPTQAKLFKALVDICKTDSKAAGIQVSLGSED